MSDTIYEPQEDSFLLEKYVKKFSKGNVLDLGCGSGIQGKAALSNKKVLHVTFSDINKDAIIKLKKNLKDDKASFIESDLFTNIRDKYDTIIFNPPYLPKDELDDEALITTGGNEGYELIIRFLEQAKTYLNESGIILIIFSSLSRKHVIDKKIRELSYEKQLLEKHDMFMERLYVYLIRSVSDNILRGHRGIVEIKMLDNKKVAVKKALNTAYDPKKEAMFLEKLNKRNIGPKLIKHDNNSITIEYIEGSRIIDYFKNSTKKEILKAIKEVIHQLIIMDQLKINKLEMTNPYKHIIVSSTGPVMIDFERCIYTENPKNITQFIQFICSGRIIRILREKDISVDNKKLLEIAKDYKKNHDKNVLEKILTSLR